MLKKIVFILMTFLLLGCEKQTPTETGQTFEISVHSQDGQPVVGAFVEGGIDWDAFSVQTNEAGMATLPGKARNNLIAIYKTNYLPVVISRATPSQYTLNKASKKLTLIGSVAGSSVKFMQGQLITLDYGGNYHHYSYSDQTLAETFTSRLHDSAKAIKDIRLLSDTLWFSTHESGLFAFLIQNPTSPQFICRINIPGYLGPFAVKDSLVFLGSRGDPGPFRILSYQTSGQWAELASVRNFFVGEMSIVGNAVFLLAGSQSLPIVFDVSNPRSPQLLYHGVEWEFQSGLFYKKFIVLAPNYGYSAPIRLDYKLIDFSDPAKPISVGLFASDSWINKIVSDNIAIGTYYYHSSTISVLQGSLSTSFETMATISGYTLGSDNAAFPPYYLIGGRLWKLEDWN